MFQQTVAGSRRRSKRATSTRAGTRARRGLLGDPRARALARRPEGRRDRPGRCHARRRQDRRALRHAQQAGQADARRGRGVFASTPRRASASSSRCRARTASSTVAGATTKSGSTAAATRAGCRPEHPARRAHVSDRRRVRRDDDVRVSPRAPPRVAIDEITRCAGTQFDPELADAFVKLIRSVAQKKCTRARALITHPRRR